MLRRGLLYVGFVGIVGLGTPACASSKLPPSSASMPDGGTGGGTDGGKDREITVQAYEAGLSQVHAANPDLHLSIATDPEAAGGAVLTVQYPAPTDDPAARDVNCDAENQDWTAGSAIAFQIKPALPLNFSLSFLDRNHVAYTTWTELRGGVWQQARIAFADMKPNPYFQPPDAKRGTPIDVSEVTGIAFAPHDQSAGSYAVGKFVVVK